jgi:hypothetical protein
MGWVTREKAETKELTWFRKDRRSLVGALLTTNEGRAKALAAKCAGEKPLEKQTN